MSKPSGQLRVVGGQHKGRNAVARGVKCAPDDRSCAGSPFNILDHLVLTDRDGSPAGRPRVGPVCGHWRWGQGFARRERGLVC